MPIKKEIIDYYKEVDFSILSKSVNTSFRKLKKLKTDKAKLPWVLKIYTEYLQLIEIFCINVLIISENRLCKNLFISNPKLRNKIKDIFLNKKVKNIKGMDFMTYFLESWVFGIREKNSINNLNEKRELYAEILKEALNDYLKDYDLLNAYKHGFRTKAKGSSNISIKREGGTASPFIIGKFNATIIYLIKRKSVIYECHLSFNWERVNQKYFFLLNMLENMKKILLANGKEIQLDTLYPMDKNKFHKHRGAFRVNIPM